MLAFGHQQLAEEPAQGCNTRWVFPACGFQGPFWDTCVHGRKEGTPGPMSLALSLSEPKRQVSPQLLLVPRSAHREQQG